VVFHRRDFIPLNPSLSGAQQKKEYFYSAHFAALANSPAADEAGGKYLFTHLPAEFTRHLFGGKSSDHHSSWCFKMLISPAHLAGVIWKENEGHIL